MSEFVKSTENANSDNKKEDVMQYAHGSNSL